MDVGLNYQTKKLLGSDYVPYPARFSEVPGVVVVPLLPLKLLMKPRSTLSLFSGSVQGALVEDWLNECELVANDLRWNDNKKLKEFSKKLQGEALSFYRNKLASVTSYAVWRQALMEKFTLKDRTYYIGMLCNLRQKANQSVKEFAEELDSTIVKAMGLRFVTTKSLYIVRLQAKLYFMAVGLRQDVWRQVNCILNNADRPGRLPTWRCIVESAQDAEWLIELQKKKTERQRVCKEEACEEVCIAASAKLGERAGYGIYFPRYASRSVSETVDKSMHQTSNVAQIYAAVRSIQVAKVNAISRLRILTNSDYLLKFVDMWAEIWLTNGWRKANGRPVVNREHWCALLAALMGIDVQWAKIPDDKHNIENEAHRLARSAVFQ